jgi:hypothetical protein
MAPHAVTARERLSLKEEARAAETILAADVAVGRAA